MKRRRPRSQTNKAPGQRALIRHPETFSSDRNGSVRGSDETEQVATLQASVYIDGSDRAADVNAILKNKTVVLLSDSVDQSQPSTSEGWRQSFVTSTSDGKLFLAPTFVARGTVKTPRVQELITGQKPFFEKTDYPDERDACLNSHLDEVSEHSTVSGLSSPHSLSVSHRCSECQKLFSKMKRRGTSRTKKNDHDPASLQCDQWLLIKTWQPQRRWQKRGRLWSHLKRIRKIAAERSNIGLTITRWSFCSRPHVFLKRNLRHCAEVSSVLKGLSDSKNKLHHRRHHRAKASCPPISMRCQRPKKRKILEEDGTSQCFSTLDITTYDKKDKLLTADDGGHSGLQQEGKIHKKFISDDREAGVSLDKQVMCDDLKGTCSALQFNHTPNAATMETQKPSQGLVCKSTGMKLSNSFPPPGVQQGSFRSMLAMFGKSHNRIIKELQH